MFKKLKKKKKGEAADDLIGNKIADKITLIGKSKKDTTQPQQNNEINEMQEIYISPEGR